MSVVGALALVLAIAGPVAAYDHTNYAGRPLSPNGAIDDCHGIAYGKVNGSLVLFMAYHCSKGPGQAEYGHDGERLGVWASDWGGASANDFGYIWLDLGEVPVVKNEIYRGVNPACPTCADHWTTTVAYPTAALGCDNIDSKFRVNNSGGTVYDNFHRGYSTTEKYETGYMTDYFGSHTATQCLIESGIFWHGPTFKDSSTPVTYGATTNQPVGFMTNRDVYTNLMNFSPFYDGWKKANDYWIAHSNMQGIHLCYDANCT